MITGKTASGFEYSINPNVINDYRLLKKIREAEKEDMTAMIDVMEMILGKDQSEKLENHLQLDDKTVPIDRIEKEIIDIFTHQKEIKNS